MFLFFSRPSPEMAAHSLCSSNEVTIVRLMGWNLLDHDLIAIKIWSRSQSPRLRDPVAIAISSPLKIDHGRNLVNRGDARRRGTMTKVETSGGDFTESARQIDGKEERERERGGGESSQLVMDYD
ncbi:hypothetical protein TIFTF001_033533 [Ficus carica]|uniref:Uncharacterized protein n=1 Tax=Ficus carica TaxID=3494 RepID=A0AA88J7R0_FICCA|nr:hypothetical protein TIFTF001_033533 [Ficus carica]